ncbi:MAG: hypothetical protein HQ502_11480 [Alphaproteobacteria bacterium]|nr:hypothetical protein [Alphaproteobacteria bacterium]
MAPRLSLTADPSPDNAPGHTNFLKTMITGAAASDAVLLLIDATAARH